jgi:hypothetical protein
MIKLFILVFFEGVQTERGVPPVGGQAIGVTAHKT